MNFSFFYETLRLGLVNLHLHKLRSFLTTLGIVIGVLAVITMLAIGEGGKRETLRTVEQLGATNIIMRTVPPPDLDRRRGDPSFGIKLADLTAIKAEMQQGAFRDVVLAVPVRDSGLDIVYGDKRADKCAAVATTPDFIHIANLAVDRGRFLTATDMEPDTKLPVCVLGAGAAKKMFGNEDPLDEEEPKQIRIQSQRGSKEFTVVGVLKSVGSAGSKGAAMSVRDLNDDVYFPLATDDKGEVTGPGVFGFSLIKRSPSGQRDVKIFELTQIYLRVTSVEAVRPVAAALSRYIETRPAGGSDVTLDVPLELLRQAEEQQQLWNWVLGGVATLSLLVGGIGIMNISLATVTERTREIGIRRALGGKKRHIVVQFLIETMTLSGVGGLVGVVAGIITPMGVTWAVKAFADKSFPTYVTPTSVILSFTISAGVGVLAGLYPAIVAANKDPIESLRHD